MQFAIDEGFDVEDRREVTRDLTRDLIDFQRLTLHQNGSTGWRGREPSSPLIPIARFCRTCACA